MKIEFHRDFRKKYAKLAPKIKNQVKKKLELFAQDPYDIQLNNHALTGAFSHWRTINITGDIRAVFVLKDAGPFFINIGTHSKLYG
jgi:addiction module RelE/StbE family toxin